MTIAAGILCADAIVMCADSEESDYVAKYQTQKIRGFDDKLLITGAGSGPYIDMTFDKIQCRFHRHWPEDSAKARAAVERIVYDIHTRHLRDVLGADTAAANRLDLVVAVKCENDHLALIGTCGTATYVASSTESGPMAGGIVVAGSGRPLFEYWARLFNIDRLTSAEVTYLSMFIIREVKENVPGCGGATYCVSLPRIRPNTQLHSVTVDEKLLGGFPGTSIDMLRHCMQVNTPADDEAFERMLEYYVTNLRSLRSSFKNTKKLPSDSQKIVRTSEG